MVKVVFIIQNTEISNNFEQLTFDILPLIHQRPYVANDQTCRIRIPLAPLSPTKGHSGAWLSKLWF